MSITEMIVPRRTAVVINYDSHYRYKLEEMGFDLPPGVYIRPIIQIGDVSVDVRWKNTAQLYIEMACAFAQTLQNRDDLNKLLALTACPDHCGAATAVGLSDFSFVRDV